MQSTLVQQDGNAEFAEPEQVVVVSAGVKKAHK
jgi:hypothetical protein